MNHDTHHRDSTARARPTSSLPFSRNDAATKSQSAAVRGAALAFTARPPPMRSNNSYVGSNGATAAAAMAGGGARPVAVRRTSQPLGVPSSPSAPRRGRTAVLDKVRHLEEVAAGKAFETTPSSQQSSLGSSPSQPSSQLAAQLASAKSRQHDDIKPERPSVKPRLASADVVGKGRTMHHNDETAVQRNADSSLTAFDPSIAAPTPIRPLTSQNLAIANVLAVEQNPPSRPISLLSEGLDASQRGPLDHDVANAAARTATPAKVPPKPAPKKPVKQKSTAQPEREEKRRSPSPPRFATKPVPIEKPKQTVEDTRGRGSPKSPNGFVAESPLSPSDDSFVSLPNDSQGSLSTLAHESTKSSSRVDLVPARLSSHTSVARPLRDPRTGLTEQTLADAIVASSLASSRAPSPTKRRPLPPPRRHSKSKTFFLPHHHHHNIALADTDYSRTPSPSKTMRHTLRAQPKSDDEGEKWNVRRGRRHMIRKHPNKHHEGDRKRWRDAITEREKKRYEGVWAANRGLWIAPKVASLARSQTVGEGITNTLHRGKEENMVLNLVVRDIWSRSRLPGEVLEEVWGLVDRRGTGMLERDEFVVGMWLIDQKLKGRKLPSKVSDSVWGSLRYPQGIKGVRPNPK